VLQYILKSNGLHSNRVAVTPDRAMLRRFASMPLVSGWPLAGKWYGCWFVAGYRSATTLARLPVTAGPAAEPTPSALLKTVPQFIAFS
jgi:hypothetical protein